MHATPAYITGLCSGFRPPPGLPSPYSPSLPLKVRIPDSYAIPGNGLPRNSGEGNGGPPPVTAKDIEAIMAKAPAGPVQTIRIEQAPLKITTDDKPYTL